jgi:1-deoxyxylulose-5-phosphate synthase
VSEIGFGALEIGRDWGVVSTDRAVPVESDAIALLEHVLACGINFIDTAAAYVKSEERIAIALTGGRIRRDDFYLATKAGERFEEGAGSQSDYTYAGIMCSCRESLERLQVDRVDLLQLHTAPLEVVRQGDGIRALCDLRKAGVCDYVGASFSDEQACVEAIETGAYDTVQITYNLLDRAAAERILEWARRADLGVIIKMPFAKGLLSKQAELLPPDDAAKVAPYRFLERQGQTLAQAALRFVLNHPAVSVVIPGTKRVAHLEQILGATDGTRLANTELERIRKIPPRA